MTEAGEVCVNHPHYPLVSSHISPWFIVISEIFSACFFALSGVFIKQLIFVFCLLTLKSLFCCSNRAVVEQRLVVGPSILRYTIYWNATYDHKKYTKH